MSQHPATLLDLVSAQAPDTPWPEHTGLVLIDVQGEYGPRGALPLPRLDDALARLGALRRAALRAGLVVTHIRHEAPSGSPLFAHNSPGSAFLPGFEPGEGEMCLRKTMPSSFFQTGLHERLQDLRVHRLILGGFMSHMCVESTAREACERGYQVFVAEDACASRDLPSALGQGVLDAARVHEAAMSFLADRFAFVRSAAWIMEHLIQAA